MRLVWKPLAIQDRERIMNTIARDNPAAAIALDEEFESKAEQLPQHPKLYKPGRVKGTREMVVRPNYVIVYRIQGRAISILRVIHAAQRWPMRRKA